MKLTQETFEENSESYKSAENLFKEIYGYEPEIISGNQQHELLVAALQKGIVYGAKWQKEQDKNKYSEEDLEDKTLLSMISIMQEYSIINESSIVQFHDEWFEQFKKK